MMNLYRLLCFFCISLASHSVFATDYFVGNAGNNANSGTTTNTPWQTIQFGIDQLQPGDALYILPGTYPEKVTFNVSGTPSDPILVASYTMFDLAVMDGTGNTSQNAMIDITDQSNITIYGLHIRNNIMNDAQGILVQGNCQNIKLDNNIIHDIHFSNNPNDVATENTNAQAIIVFGSDPLHAITGLLIRDNHVLHCRLGYSEGIAVNGNVDGFEVTTNFVNDLTNIGIVAIGHEQTCPDPLLDQARNGRIFRNHVFGCHSPYAACGGIYVDGAKDIQIVGNIVYENDYGIEIGCEHPGKTASGITARNNIIRDNTIAGMALGGYDYPNNSGSVINSTVYNNDFYKNDSLYDGNGELVISYAENCTIENNLFYTNDQLRAITFADAATTTVNLNYNLYFLPQNDPAGLIGTTTGERNFTQFQQEGQEANGLYADPLLNVNETDASFMLANNWSSPCVDAGNPNYQPLPGETDYFMQPRIGNFSQQAIVDIGASELVVESLSELEKASSIVFPNPSSTTISIQSMENWQTIELLDLYGKTVLKKEYKGEPVDISGLASGRYLLRCSNTTSVSITPVIKM